MRLLTFWLIQSSLVFAIEKTAQPSFQLEPQCAHQLQQLELINQNAISSLNEIFAHENGFISAIRSAKGFWIISREERFQNRVRDFREEYHLIDFKIRVIQIEGHAGTETQQREAIEKSIYNAFYYDYGSGCLNVKIDPEAMQVTVLWDPQDFSELSNGWPQKIGPYNVMIKFP